MFTIIPFTILFSQFGGYLHNEPSNPIPQWFFVMQGFSYFIYRMFDEMDGKQARKTGNSSPLGLIFDHGVDSLTVSLQGLIMVKSIQLGDGASSFIPISFVCMIFYFYMLEEYYLGSLDLGPFNAVSDGSLILIGFYVLMAIYGNSFCTNELFTGYSVTVS